VRKSSSLFQVRCQESYGKVIESVRTPLIGSWFFAGKLFRDFQGSRFSAFPNCCVIKFSLINFAGGSQNTIINIEGTSIEPFADPFEYSLSNSNANVPQVYSSLHFL